MSLKRSAAVALAGAVLAITAPQASAQTADDTPIRTGRATPDVLDAGERSDPTGGRLTLADAVRQALESSPMILRAEANRQAARQGYKEARVSWLPSVTVREVALRTTSPADVFGLQLMQERFSFPAFTQADPNDPDAFDNFTTEVEAKMPVFAGGRIWLGIAQADKMADAAEAVSEHTEKAVEMAVAGAYMDALLSREAVDLAERARETTARHLDQAQAYFDAGMLVESDLLQAQVQLARMAEEVIRARNTARLAQAGLAMAMGVDQTREFELTGELPHPEIPFSTMDEALAAARERRRDLAAASKQLRAAELGVKQAWGGYLPEIGVQARYAWNDDTLFGTNGDSYTLVAAAEWNVWNWGQTHHRIARSRHEKNAALQGRRSLEQQVEFEVRRALQNVQEGRQRHEVARGAVGSAERALSILEERFDQEVARMTDLLDAETLAHEARVRELSARFDLQKAIRNLYFATGGSPVPEVNS